MEQLISRHCRPIPSTEGCIHVDQMGSWLKQVGGWMISEKRLTRSFEFKNFQKALDFVNTVGVIAEKEDHHPDILMHGYRHVKISLDTHTVSGVTENDFIMAAKINQIQL